jgi:hypothetical protein
MTANTKPTPTCTTAPISINHFSSPSLGSMQFSSLPSKLYTTHAAALLQDPLATAEWNHFYNLQTLHHALQ